MIAWMYRFFHNSKNEGKISSPDIFVDKFEKAENIFHRLVLQIVPHQMLLERSSVLLFSRSDIIKNVPEITQTTANDEKAMPSDFQVPPKDQNSKMGGCCERILLFPWTNCN